jgi:outer membrane protein, heavy metal efflux system
MCRRLGLLVLSALSSFGCAAMDLRPELEAVRALVADRSRGRVQLADLEPQADARVAELLAGEVDAEEAVEVALLRNRSLQALLADVGVAQAELVRARALPNPVLSAEVRFGEQDSGTGGDYGLVNDVMALLQRPLRTRVAQAELESTKLTIASAVFELTSEVRAAFFRAQGAEQELEMRQQVARSLALVSDVARRQHDAGNLADLERAQQEALEQEARLALAEAEVAAIEERERLTALLGLWGGETRWTLARRLPPLPAEERVREGIESLAVERRLDLAAAKQRVVASSASPALLRLWSWMPQSVGGVAEREVERGGLWSLGPSLELAIPLFDRGRADQAVARAQRRRSEAELASLAVQIRSDVRRTWARFEASRARVLYYQNAALPLRTQILEQRQREYNGMLIGVYELLQAKREQIESGGEYVSALRDYWIARVELERALGTQLPLGEPAQAPAAAPSAVPSTSPQSPQSHEHK